MGMHVRLVKRFKKKLMSFYLSKTKKTEVILGNIVKRDYIESYKKINNYGIK